MSCEKYKVDDYSAKARACRNKAAEGELSDADQNAVLKARFDEQEAEYNNRLKNIERDEKGNAVNNSSNRLAINLAQNQGSLLAGTQKAFNASIKKLNVPPPTVEDWNTQTASIIDANPNATTEDLEAITNRPGGPTAKQIKFVKDRNAYKETNTPIVLEDPGGNTTSFVENLYKNQAASGDYEASTGFNSMEIGEVEKENENKPTWFSIAKSALSGNIGQAAVLYDLKNKEEQKVDEANKGAVKKGSKFDDNIAFLEKKKKEIESQSPMGLNTENSQNVKGIDAEIARLRFRKQEEDKDDRTVASNNYLDVKEEISDSFSRERKAIEENNELTKEEKIIQNEALDERALSGMPKGLADEYKINKKAIAQVTTAKVTDTWSSFAPRDSNGNLLGDEYSEKVLPSLKVEAVLIDLLNSDPSAKRKLNNGTFNLESKEQLINTAKYVVLGDSFKENRNEFSKANEMLYKYKDLKNIPSNVITAYNKIRSEAVTTLQDVNCELAYNVEENAFQNNFVMTDQFQDWRDRHIDGSVTGDISDAVGTTVQGLIGIGGDTIVGSSIWLTSLGVDAKAAIFGKDMEDEQNMDYLEDVWTKTKGFNAFGVSDKDSSIFNDGLSFRSATKTIGNMLPFTIGVAMAARKGDVKGVRSAYSMMKGMGANQNLINKFRMGSFAFKATIQDNYMEGKDLGLDGPQAHAYGAGMSFATAIVQGIMPDANFFNTSAGKGFTKTLAGSLKKAATAKGRKTIIKQAINNLIGEIGEEEAELLMQDIVKATAGLSNEMKFFDLETQVETIAGTVLLTGSTSAVTSKSQMDNTRKAVYNEYRNNAGDMLTTLKDSKIHAQSQLETAKQNGNKKAISRAELQLKQIESASVYGVDLIKAINIAPDIMNDAQVDLLREKMALIRQKEKLRANSGSKVEVDKRIDEIDAQIEGTAVTENKGKIKEQIDKNVEKLAADVGVNFDSVEDSAGALAKIEEENKRITEENRNKDKDNQQELINIDRASDNGFIIQNPDGTQSIIINQDVAKKNEAITTASHELFHGVLFQTLQKNPGAISGMADGLRKEVSQMIETDVSFNNSFVQQKLDAYKNDPNSVKDEELLTIFSEGMAEGYIKYEENSFTKLGDILRRTLSAAGVKAKFNTGKDVYNFIKDFNRGVEKGNFSKGIKRTAKEGASQVKISKKSVFNYDASNEQKIAIMYATEGNMQQKAITIANEYRAKVQALINTTDKNVFGSQQKRNDIQSLLTDPDVPNSIYNTVMNYDANSEISLDETIGRALMPSAPSTKSSKSSSSGDIKSELDGFVQDNNGEKKYETKKEFQQSEDFGLAFDKIENSNLLDGLIRQGVSEGYLQMNPDFVADAKRRVGEKFTKEFDPSKNESLFGWLTGKNKGGQSILNFAKGDIQNKNKKTIDTTSIDSGTRQIADNSIAPEVKRENQRTLNPNSLLTNNEDSNQFLEDTKKELSKMSTEELSDIRYNTSQSVAQKAFAKIFGVPASRIFDKTDNFRKGDAKEIQRFILKNASKLIKLLPEGNAPVRVVASKSGRGTVERGGEGVALPRTLQNLFYVQLKNKDGKPKKIDSESGKQSIQYRKNPGITQSEFLESFGIKDGKIDPNFVPRSSQAQAIKGLMEIAARNVTNLAARQELDTRKDIADGQRITLIEKMSEGKAKVMSSSSGKVDVFNLQDSQVLGKQLRENLAEFQTASQMKFGTLSKTEKVKYNELVDRYQEEYLGKPKWISETEAMAEIKSEQRINPTPEFIAARNKWLNDIAPLVDISFIQSEVIAKSRRGMFRNINEVYSALGVKNKKEALSKFGNSKLKLPTKLNYSGKNIKTAANFRKLINTQAFKDNEALKMPYLKSIASAMELDLSNNPENLAMWESFLYDSGNNTTSIIRRTAPVKFFSIIDGKEVVEEHSMPANNVAKFLLLSAFTGKVDQNFGLIENNYFQGALRKEDDLKLRGPGFNYIANMPDAFFTMENLTTWVRYNNKNVAKINGGIDFNTYEMLDGRTVATTLVDQGMAIVEANVKAENVLEKGKKEAEKIVVKSSKDVKVDPLGLNDTVNQIIQDTKGIAKDKNFSDIVAKRRGAGFKGFRLITAGAQDFQGLMYDLYSRGKKGEAQQKWVNDNLIKPYSKGVADIDTYRQTLKNDYSALLKQFPDVRKKLGKIVPGTDFTYDQALRVNLWTKAGYEIPGISKRDAKKLNNIVSKNPELSLFNDAALLVSKQDKWVEPSPHWDVESLISDLNNLTSKIGRKQFLAEYIANTKIIFSKENLNKMEVALGTNWREAIEDSLYRMENGTNRPSGSNKLTNQFNNWVNNSIGAIMFFNRKSALLQLISSVNFMNWSDNNPYNAAKAFANQKQFWKDFSMLWNSAKLKQRRSGLRKDVNEAEIANAAKGSKNKAQAVLSYLLKIGFTPTQLADSFAIASGGSTFYRNRANTYMKQGMSQADAESKAFEDFSATSDVSQQSSDPMLISMQQASVLGRLLLAFQNTPAQVTRIFNKASRDFINGRGDQKTNVSKMIYYGAVQATIFAALQQALFATIPGFDDEDDEEKKDKRLEIKQERILNTVVDTMLRGSGVYGAILATLKNTINTYFKEESKDAFNVDHRNTLLEALNLSAPISSKLRKLNNAIKTKNYDEDVINQRGWDVTADGKVNLSPSYNVLGSLVEAITNLPMERMVVEINGLVESLDSRNTTFQRIALALGYRTWDVNSKNEENDLIKIEVKATKKEERKQKVIDDRAERKRIEEEKRFEGKTDEEVAIIKRKDVIFKQSRSKQIKDLLDLGLTKKEIKALQYEEARVNKIIELQNKK